MINVRVNAYDVLKHISRNLGNIVIHTKGYYIKSNSRIIVESESKEIINSVDKIVYDKSINQLLHGKYKSYHI